MLLHGRISLNAMSLPVRCPRLAPVSLASAMALLAGAACGTPPGGADDNSSQSTESSTSDTDTTGTDDGDETDSTGEEDEGPSFTIDPDMAVETPCDPLSDECPEGQKCAPNGMQEWEEFRCVDIDPDPKPPGAICELKGGLREGLDDCEKGALCVPGDTESGICHPYCNEFMIECGDGGLCIGLGVAFTCFLPCDVVAQDCGDGSYCGSSGFCFPGDGFGAGYGEPCSQSPCGPGLHCRPADEVPDCGDTWCCTPLCWADDPMGDDVCPDQAMTCEPLDPDGLGYCALP